MKAIAQELGCCFQSATSLKLIQRLHDQFGWTSARRKQVKSWLIKRVRRACSFIA